MKTSFLKLAGLSVVFLATLGMVYWALRNSERLDLKAQTETRGLSEGSASSAVYQLSQDRQTVRKATSRSLSKEWAEFKNLKSKVLKTAQEQARFYSELESREFMKAAFNKLSELPPSVDNTEDAEREDRAQRMAAIDWIDEALSWKENPRRTEVIEGMARLVSRELVPMPIAASAKQTLVGDKIELIGLLAATDSALAAKLEEKFSASKEHRLFQYAKTMYGLKF